MENEVGNFKAKDCRRKTNSRRSSFFRRKSSFYGDSNSFTEQTGTDYTYDCKAEEENQITQYINSLKCEKENWKKALKQLKKENNDFKEKCSQVTDHISCWELLTPEDKKFIEQRPDLVSVGRLLDSTTEALALRKYHISLLSDKLNHLVFDCSQTITDQTDRVISRWIHQFDELDLREQLWEKHKTVYNEIEHVAHDK